MRSLLAIIIACIVILAGCGPADDKTDILPEDIAGTYSGVVPCADCEGIDYSLMLMEDYTFSDRMDYVGKSANAIAATGSFKIVDGVILLNKPTEGYRKFMRHPQGLLMLDKDGNQIEGSTAALYVLKRIDEESDIPSADSMALPDSSIKPTQDNTELEEVVRAKLNRQMKGWEQGINFYGLGNEPFWNLAIDFSTGMSFMALGNQDIQTPMGIPSQKDDGKYRKYEAASEDGELIVELVEEECVDQMSGEEFDYLVTVMAKYSGDREYRTYKGCGEYVVDPRLHNIWIVEEFEGQKIDATSFDKGIPQFEINVRDNVYMGHDGCNSIRGNISVTFDKIQFEAGPITLMSCDDNGLSSKISMALTETAYKFEVGSRLKLKKEGQVRFVLKNVD